MAARLANVAELGLRGRRRALRAVEAILLLVLTLVSPDQLLANSDPG